MPRRALIIGVRGQDGSFLAEQLAGRGYHVTGLGRTSDTYPQTSVENHGAISALIADLHPDEIYYLAAYHHSSEDILPPEHALVTRSLMVHTIGLLNVLDAMVTHAPRAKLFYAASSHIHGDPIEVPQTERTQCHPNSAYGTSKFAGLCLLRQYRERYNIFCAGGILYTHESERRGPGFLSRRIIDGALAISRGKQKQLALGNLTAEVDWGYAPEYTDAMWNVLQLSQPTDVIIATGKRTSVCDFVEGAFGALRLDWRSHITVDPGLIKRAPSGNPRIGDSGLLHGLTGWRATVTGGDLARTILQRRLAQGE